MADWTNKEHYKPGGGYWLKQLQKPVTAEVGLSDEERQDIFNLARRQSQGATNAAAAEMAQKMSGKGFRGGESGIADTAIGDIYSKGAEELGKFSQEQSINEANKRFEENMALNTANQNRLLGGGGLQSQFDQLASMNEQFGKTFGLQEQQFDWQKQQDLWNSLLGLNQYMGNEQQQVWSHYYDAIRAADTYGG